MSAFTLYLVILYVVLAIQSIFFRGIKPDMALVIVCLYSHRYGRMKGMAFGVCAGILIDTINGFILGPHLLSKAVSGYGIGLLKDTLYQWNVFVNTLVMILLSIMNIVLVYACLDIFSDATFANRSIGISAIEVLYTVIAALLFYLVARPVDEYAPSGP